MSHKYTLPAVLLLAMSGCSNNQPVVNVNPSVAPSPVRPAPPSPPVTPSPVIPPVPVRNRRPVGFFMTHSWWWTPINKYEHIVPQADFDWIVAHGNGDYVAEMLQRPAVVEYGIAFNTRGGADSPWFIPDNARVTLKAALQKLTQAQFGQILAYTLVDEPDIRNVDGALFAEAIKIMREVSVEVFGYSPPVLIVYSYLAFSTGTWPCFALADTVAFDYYPVTYVSGDLDATGGGSTYSWKQMLSMLYAKKLPNQKLTVIVETATTKPELVGLLRNNLKSAMRAIEPMHDDISFIVGFNYQGILEGENQWVGAADLPALQWREILR